VLDEEVTDEIINDLEALDSLCLWFLSLWWPRDELFLYKDDK
jgi:hypothetical protein